MKCTKKARLFEVNGKNLAYIYADKNVRQEVGDEEKKSMNHDDDDQLGIKLLKQWNLERYIEILIDENGYDDVQDWPELGVEELKRYGLKDGHAKKFVRMTKQYFEE